VALEDCGKKISVVIPIYNVEPYLARCLDSVVNQTYRNLEIILIDDGSTDAGGFICDSYMDKDSRIKVIHKANGGLSSARNAGINIAGGDYITFIDSDDWVDLRYFEILLSKALEFDSPVVQCNFCSTWDDRSRPTHIKFKGASISFTNQNTREIFLGTVLPHLIDYFCCGKLIKTDVLNRYAIRCVDTKEVFYEDKLFTLSLLCVIDRIDFVDDCLYYYYNRANSLATAPRRIILKEMINIAARFDDFLATLPSDKKRLLENVVEVIAFVYVCNEYRFALQKNDAEIIAKRTAALRALRKHPNAVKYMLRAAFGRGMTLYRKVNGISAKTALGWRMLALGLALGKPDPFLRYI